MLPGEEEQQDEKKNRLAERRRGLLLSGRHGDFHQQPRTTCQPVRSSVNVDTRPSAFPQPHRVPEPVLIRTTGTNPGGPDGSALPIRSAACVCVRPLCMLGIAVLALRENGSYGTDRTTRSKLGRVQFKFRLKLKTVQTAWTALPQAC